MDEKPNFTGEPRFPRFKCFDPTKRQPRFKQGDRVVYMLNSEPKFCGTVTQVNEHQGTTESNHYYTYHIRFDHGMDAKWVNEFWLMPCEDPKPRNEMKLNEYQEAALKTAVYPEDKRIIYPALGMCGEAGEVADKVKKVIRDNNQNFDTSRKIEIAYEIGDVLWYCATMAHDLGFTLEAVAQMNIDKLASRQRRGKLGGSGDHR